MNESCVLGWMAVTYSEHQGQDRFGMTDEEFCFEHEKFEIPGRHLRRLPEGSWVLRSGAQEGGVGWRHRFESLQ